MMYIGGADIVANKPMYFDLVLFFSIHLYLCRKACIKTVNGLNANATILNEYRSRKVFAKIMQYIYDNHLSADGK